MTPPNRSRACPVAATAFLTTAGCVVSIIGCASHATTDAKDSTAATSAGTHRAAEPTRDGMAELRKLADQQRTHPDASSGVIPAPPGLPLAELAPIPAEGPVRTAALASVDEAIGMYPPLTTRTPAEAPEPPDEDQRVQSMKLYASARESLADGRSAQAASELERAAKLDPSSAQIQRSLGDANAAAGKRFAALTAYKKAVQLGIRDPALLGVLGREALRSRRFDEAIAALKAARDAAEAEGDTAILAPFNVDLAEALLGAGYVSAARDLLAATLRPLPNTPPEGVSAASAAEVFRRRAELWQRVGDLSMRLGNPEAAREAYATAASFPTVDPVSLVPRRIYALVRSGQTAEAALLLLSEIDRVQGRIEDRHLSTLSSLAASPTIGGPLADALAQTIRNPASTVTPSTAGRLARASAACVPPPDARRILTARLEAHPTDIQCLPPLLAAYGDDARGRIQCVVKLVAIAPDQCDEYAEAFLRRGSGVSAALAWLTDRKGDPSAVLFRAALLRRLHRYNDALTVLDTAKPPPAMQPAFAAMRASCAASAGKWEAALKAKDAALAFDEPAPARDHAAALLAVQSFAAAYAELGVEPSKPDAPAWRGVPDCLLAADLALRAGKVKDAEAWLIAAQKLDKFDERAYEGLLDLYAPKGPLADDTKLTGLVRGLRDNIPSSKLARSVAARELLSRGLWDQAAEQLRSMVDADSESLGTLSLLAAAWENQIKADAATGEAAEAWLRERMKGREESPTLAMVLARVMAARGHGEAAVALLEEKQAALPNPDLLRMREVIIRANLGDPKRAAALAVERLESGPRGIDETIELADAYFAATEYDRALTVLSDGLPTGIPFTTEQSAKILSLLAVFKAEQVAGGDASQGEAALRLFDLILARGIELPPQSYLLRVLVLCASHPGETERLVAAAKDAAGKTQQTEAAVYARIGQVLLAAKDPGPGLRFLGAVVNQLEPFNEALAFGWFSLTYARGSEADFRFMVQSIAKPGELVRRIETEVESVEVLLESDRDKRAELAYWLANGASGAGREELAEQAYRLALEYKPDHAWTLNNLGYLILERGDNFPEAERMVEAAYKELGSDPSVIDSLGWVRYKQGIFADGKGADGAVVRGAVSLLRDAVNSGVKETNAEQADHLGDALWRLGDKDEARRRWAQAQNLIQVDIAKLNARNLEGSPARTRMNRQLMSVQSKLQAVSEGKDPAVAPTQAEFEARRSPTK